MSTGSDPFDPANLTLDLEKMPASAPRDPGLPRHKAGEWFLKGPVPWNWIESAARLPGQALYVGLTVWREAARRKKHPTPLNLSAIGLDRSTARRALKALEEAGLVELEHRPGRLTLVAIQPASIRLRPT